MVETRTRPLTSNARALAWVVTHHAVERYIERHAPTLAFASAKARLLTELGSARPLRRRTNRGDFRWLVPGLDLVAIVKEDSGRVVVTVEPPRPDDITEEQDAEFVEAAAKLPGVRLDDLRQAPEWVRADLIEAASRAPAPAPVEAPPVPSGARATEPARAPEDFAPAAVEPPLVRCLSPLRTHRADPPGRCSLAPSVEELRAENLRRELQISTMRLAEVKEREKTERVRLHAETNNERLKEALRTALVALDACTRALAEVKESFGAEHVAAMLEVAQRRAAKVGGEAA